MADSKHEPRMECVYEVGYTGTLINGLVLTMTTMLYYIQMCMCCSIIANDVASSQIYVGDLGAGWSARVLQHIVLEAGAPEHVDDQGFLRGGDLRTTVLVMLLNDPKHTHVRHVAWTYAETRRRSVIELYGIRRPAVEDVVRRDDSILILHIAESKNRLTIVGRDRESSEWKTIRSVDLDLSSLATGQEEVGLAGRIVQIETNTYLHFWHASLPGNVVYRVDMDYDVAVESDGSVVDAVINADG